MQQEKYIWTFETCNGVYGNVIITCPNGQALFIHYLLAAFMDTIYIAGNTAQFVKLRVTVRVIQLQM